MFEDWEKEQLEWKQLQSESQGQEDEWKKWQELLLQEFLRWQDEEKSKTGGELEDIPEEIRRRQLFQIIRRIEKIPGSAHADLVQQYLDDLYRMGPAQPLWEQPYVSDIQIFVPYEPQYPQIITYTERGKRFVYQGTGFRDMNHARDWVNHHLSRIGLRYDPSKVQLDGMFPNGERIHVISGPCGYSMFHRKTKTYTFVRSLIISIRRFVASFAMDELTDQAPVSYEIPQLPKRLADHQKRINKRTVYAAHSGGMADQATMDYLRIAVQMKKNYIIAGGTGVGKTTVANALTEAIPQEEVLLVLEEAPEMQPQCGMDSEGTERSTGMVIRVYQREGVFSLADGLKAALRMFPDRIFVAELRDALAFVFLQAIQSGHDGSSTTVHASDCSAAIERIVEMAASHPSAPNRESIRNTLFDRVHTILHGTREGGQRFLDEVVELQPDGGVHKVMEYVSQGVDEEGNPIGYFAFYGPTDDFVKEMLQKGFSIPASWGWEDETA